MSTPRTSLAAFVPLHTHAALRVSDIVEVIVGHIASTDSSTKQETAAHQNLFPLSTLNRVFSASALDLLWTDEDVRALARVMPADTCHTYAVKRSYLQAFPYTKQKRSRPHKSPPSQAPKWMNGAHRCGAGAFSRSFWTAPSSA
jgi:hypothetical protein